MPEITTPRDPSFGFKRRLTATVILLNLFIYGYVAATAYQSKRKYEMQTATSTQNIAILLDQQIKDEINSIDLALHAVKHEAEEQIKRGKIDKQVLNEYIIKQHSYLPSLQGIRILDAHGDAKYGTGGITPGITVNLAFRDYFIAQRDNPERGLFISKPVLGLVAKTWIINFSRRLNHPDGSFAGIVYASLTLDHYAKLFSSLKISANSSITLRDDEMALIVRYPVLENTLGSQKVSDELAAIVKAGTRFATYKARAGIDGVRKTITYRKIADYPLGIIVAQAEDDYLADWRKEILTMLGMVVIFTVVTLVSRRMLLQRWSREQEILSDLNNARLALELRSERDRAQAYLDTVETIIVALDNEGKITTINRKGREVLGYQEDDLKGKNWFDCFLPQPAGMESIYPLFLRYMSGDVSPELEYQEYPLVMKSGEMRQIAWHNAILRNDAGAIVGYLGAGEDVTESKQAKEALARSERFLKTIFDSEPECIKLLDAECNILLMNPAGLEMIQADSLEQVKGRCVCPLITSEYRDAFTALTRQVFQGMPGTLTFETVGLKGRRLWLETRAVPFRNEEGEIVSLLGITRDVTERKHYEETLRSSEAKFRSIVETSQDWIWEMNLSGRHTFSNARISEILGYSLDEFMQMDLSSLVHQEDWQEIEARLPQLIAEKSGWRGWVIRWRHQNGNYRFLESDANPILNDTGDLVGFRGVDRDITERKEAEDERLIIEKQLLQAQKLESLGVLAGGIAHDFNNILTAIKGNISFTRMNLDISQPAYVPLVTAEKAVNKAAALAKQLLSFSKGGEPIKKPISARQAVIDAVSLALSGSNVEAVVDLPADLLAINADEGQISQAFNNLIINAVQAMPGGGKLTISARNSAIGEGNSLGLAAGNYVEIAFTDEGCGIAAEEIGKIFDPYFTTKEGGNGIGLASTYAIVKKHAGHISVSSALNAGTSFTILIPGCGEPLPEEAPGAKDTAVVPGNHSILVLDDDEMVRELAEITLKRFGYGVTCCDNGATAISLYRSAFAEGVPFSLVIMDLTIPGGMGGIEAARQILAIDPEAKLIVSSGYSEDPVMANFAEYGFCAALEKPYSVEEIISILQETERLGGQSAT